MSGACTHIGLYKFNTRQSLRKLFLCKKESPRLHLWWLGVELFHRRESFYAHKHSAVGRQWHILPLLLTVTLRSSIITGSLRVSYTVVVSCVLVALVFIATADRVTDGAKKRRRTQLSSANVDLCTARIGHLHPVNSSIRLAYSYAAPASGVQRHPRRRKMRHRNPWGRKIREFRGDKIVATRGEIFSLKFTKYRFAAGLRPDPLGEL